MDQPWYLVVAGALLSAAGGIVGWAAFIEDHAPIALIAWALGGIGSVLLLMGLVALSVAIGVRAASRR